jgi:hypothetical protein
MVCPTAYTLEFSCTTVFESDFWLVAEQMGILCTGASTVHKFGKNVHRYNKEVIFDDNSLRPDFPGGREQE